ncbi:MAG: hypothetical protein EXR82_01730 [Gammaproteobacteria bacterium]|nr:hypothetical protein [Gammaproteobacteria bacterium]
MKILDERRPPFAPMPKPATASALLARQDLDWEDDEAAILALATFQGSPLEPEVNSPEQNALERHWPLLVDDDSAHDPVAVEWRRRAWFYRSVLVVLGLDKVHGFRREATPSEKKPWRLTDVHYTVLLHMVNLAERRLSLNGIKPTHKAVFDLLKKGGPSAVAGLTLPEDLTLQNFKKRVRIARDADT